MRHGIDWAMLDRGARRIGAQKIIAFPIRRGPNWARHKTTATVRADVAEYLIRAGRAERTFVRANARLARGGRQRTLAMFAGRPEF